MDRIGVDLAERLERLYRRLNRRDWVHPDPLEFVYRYERGGDREVAGLIASSLAYGRVGQILDSVEAVLAPMGPSPRDFVVGTRPRELRRAVAGFKHRWTTGEEVGDLLVGIRRVLRRHGSIEACFALGHSAETQTTRPGLGAFVRELKGGRQGRNSLLPVPERGSACKRLHLFLRWMVRRDAVDPGCWRAVRPSQLVVPLDTHMHRVGRALGLTMRRQADIRTALEMTEAFRALRPEDPLRYDFALTRLGIRADLDLKAFLILK